MKLPSFSRFTLIPASLEPNGFAPDAIVCKPQRVFRNSTCMTTAIAIVQMISLYPQAPMNAAKSLPSGVDTGVPREMVNVRPLMKNSVPSVVTNEGIRRYTVTAPLINPTTPAATTPAISAIHVGAPASCAKCMMNGANANTMPAERSISPPIINMISPHAMIATGAMNCDRFSRLALVSRKS